MTVWLVLVQQTVYAICASEAAARTALDEAQGHYPANRTGAWSGHGLRRHSDHGWILRAEPRTLRP